MAYIEKEVEAGRTKEISRYYSIRSGIPEGTRRRKLSPTPERIKRSNMRRRADRLRQLMNANFNDKEFWSMTLTYREEPESIRQVRDDASDFVKRLRKCAKLFGVTLRFIYVIGAGPHRRHIHITLNALPDMAMLTGCWIHGHVSMTKLYSDGQYRDLAEYYIKNAQETREQEEARGEDPGQMYICSRNLIQPKVTKRVISAKTFREEPRAKKGYYVEKDSVYQGWTETGLPLLKYTLIKEKEDEGANIIHLHGRAGVHRGQGDGILPAAVCEGRTGDTVPIGQHLIHFEESKRGNLGGGDRGRYKDK